MHYSSRASLKFIATVVGIIATGGPILLFNVWIRSQGSDEVAAATAWALGSSETRLGQSIAALRDLSARGVDSCRPPHVEAMRQASLATGPVKQVMLIAANGDILCTDTGAAAAKPEVLTSAPIARTGTMLDVVRLSDGGERFLRIRTSEPRDKPSLPSLAALVPASQLLPQAAMQGGRLLGTVRMTMSDGTPVGDSGAAPDSGAQQPRFSDTQRSQLYPIVFTVSLPRMGVIADYDDLRRISLVVTGGAALLILLIALLVTQRKLTDPTADMAKAVLDDEFVPYYQPLVDLQNGRLLGAEVLVRWRRADGSLIEPNAFVALLESSGLVMDFTRKLMCRVRDELGKAVGQRPGMTLAFNVAPLHFDDALILHDVATIFNGSTVRLSQIVLELTERHEVVNLTEMRRTVAALQRVGCKIAIDDVGTGHSGLSYILKLGVDIIKIDKIFVEAIGSESHSKHIIETLIDLAKNMRMEIVAEGVETFDQVTYLRERGIGAAQGYVFAPPLPASSFLQLLDAMDPVSDPVAAAAGGAGAKAKAKPGAPAAKSLGTKPVKSAAG